MMLATATDVEKRLRRLLEADEIEDAPGLIEEASVLVEGWCRREFVDPVPPSVVVVVSRMVARVLGTKDAPVGVESTQTSAGSFQLTRKFSDGATSGGPWLAKADRQALARYRRGVTNEAMW